MNSYECDEVNKMLRAMNIDPSKASRVVIDFRVDRVPNLTITMPLDAKCFDHIVEAVDTVHPQRYVIPHEQLDASRP